MLSWLKKIGNVRAFSADEVDFSRVGIGFEKLDRAVFDPEKAYDKVAALGVKWTRIQSGWQRTETEKGVYHFEWLDDIVDNPHLSNDPLVRGIGTAIRRDPGCVGRLTAFAEQGSIRAAAKQLHMHHSSVASRLDRIEELAGVSLRSPNASFALTLALAYWSAHELDSGSTVEH